MHVNVKNIKNASAEYFYYPKFYKICEMDKNQKGKVNYQLYH